MKKSVLMIILALSFLIKISFSFLIKSSFSFLIKLSFSLVIILVLSLNVACFVYAGELSAQNEVDDQINSFDFSEADSVFEEAGVKFSFKEVLREIVSGELSISPKVLIEKLFSLILKEIVSNKDLMRNLIVVGIISALLKTLTDSFQNKGVGELGFYVCYISIIIMLFTGFNNAFEYTRALIDGSAVFMQSLIPIILSLLVISNAAGATVVFGPTLFLGVNIITVVIKGMILPLIVFGATISIVNFVTERDALSNFGDLIKNVSIWGLKCVTFLFLGFLGLQKIAAPIALNAVSKSAKAAAGAVPVVGDMINGAWDLALVWAGAIKSGMMIAVVIGVFSLCALTVVKLVTLIFIFKLAAALIQPICDERIVSCIDAVGNFSVLLLGALTAVITMLLLSVIILLSF